MARAILTQPSIGMLPTKLAMGASLLFFLGFATTAFAGAPGGVRPAHAPIESLADYVIDLKDNNIVITDLDVDNEGETTKEANDERPPERLAPPK